MGEYTQLDKILHRLALSGNAVPEMSFAFDQKMVNMDTQAVANAPHVYIAGLARAGTTVLMRKFFETGHYCSLTYLDMPFVLAPNFWKKVAGKAKRNTEATERAHGDRIQVDVNSPESLEEVFWRVFEGKNYIGKTCLKPHQPDDEVRNDYIRYITAILSAHNGTRYLCKGNNNILRLGSISRIFPNAIILVPFRDPVQQARSLLTQHKQFLDSQREDPFVKSYMSWLGHHEFGLDHRPFVFNGQAPPSHKELQSKPMELAYWMDLWIETYGWLDNNLPENARFVCYETLCENPKLWPKLAELAGLSIEGAVDQQNTFVSGNIDKKRECAGLDDTTLKTAYAIYDRLAQKTPTV